MAMTSKFTPNNRTTEVLAMFLEKKWLSHYDFAKALNQLNSHKLIGRLKQNGLKFNEDWRHFTTRYGRKSRYKKFSLADRNKGMAVYFKLNYK